MFIDKRLKVNYDIILKRRLSLKVLEGSLSFRQYIPTYPPDQFFLVIQEMQGKMYLAKFIVMFTQKKPGFIVEVAFLVFYENTFLENFTKDSGERI